MKLRTALTCLLVLGLAACGGETTSYTPCTEDAQCPADQSCQANECRLAQPCTVDGECRDGRVCLGGFCRTAECNLDADCGQDLYCVEHRCVDTPPCNCATDQDCPARHECVGGCRCQPKNCACETDLDCLPTEQCADGCSCTARPPVPCTQDSQCTQAGQLCLDLTCQAAPACADDAACQAVAGDLVCEAGRCQRACAEDADCGTLKRCVEGHCFNQCATDATCPAGTMCEENLCVAYECSQDSDCPGTNVRCRTHRCQSYTTCAIDADCPSNIYVCLAGICEERQVCAIDANCPADQVCFEGHCFPVPACVTETDCTVDQDCIGGRCLPHVCRGPADCPADQICTAGACVPAGNPALVYRVIVLTPGGPILQGQRLQLEALALTQAGTEVPGVAFAWTSSQPDRAAVDAAGVLTGGDQAGSTYVTATAVGTTRESDPVTFVNQLPAAAGELRVTAVSALDRAPVASATVLLRHAGGDETAVTDAAGQAAFTAPAGAAEVHVFSAAHDYLSIVGTSSTDLLVPLVPRSVRSSAGGFTGQMTYLGTGSLSLGLAGTSIGGNLVDLGFDRLMGQVFNVTVNLGPQSFTVPLPAQVSLMYSYSGMPIPIKPTYYVVGQPGARTAWALGGKIDGNVLMDLVGGGSIEEILFELLPYFALLRHGLRPSVDVFPMPLVADADDIDGDGDLTELRPDWAQFPDLDMAPTQEQSLAVQVTVPPLPMHAGLQTRSAILISGALTPQGFTPLGMTSAQDPGGVLEPLVMKLAPAYGGLQVGQYATLVMAFPPGSGQGLPSDVAAVVATGRDLPTGVSFASGFLPFPEDAQYTPATRSLVAGAVAGAHLVRATFTRAEGQWAVYLPAGGMVSLSLPAVPGGLLDLAGGARVTLDPMALVAGMDFEALVTFDGDDLDQLNRLATAFTTFTLP